MRKKEPGAIFQKEVDIAGLSFFSDRNLVPMVLSRDKEATSRFVHLEKFSLTFSSSSFVIRVNLLHP